MQKSLFGKYLRVTMVIVLASFIVDPSHATGVRDYVAPLSKAAIAAGADGLMIEVHPCPACALSDGPQSLTFEQFDSLTGELRPYAELSGRKF